MLSLIVPLAIGYLVVRSIASGLSGAAESGGLDVLLSAPISRRHLVAMYVIDLVGRLDPSLDWTRYASVFRCYGNAIEDGIDPWSFFGVVVAAGLLAVIGGWLFERRDLAV